MPHPLPEDPEGMPCSLRRISAKVQVTFSSRENSRKVSTKIFRRISYSNYQLNCKGQFGGSFGSNFMPKYLHDLCHT